MLVGDAREFVEPSARECAKPVEMRFQPAEILCRQIEL
jgi:hypothetical protein